MDQRQNVRFKVAKVKSTANVTKAKIGYFGKSIFRFKNGDVYLGGFKIVFPQTLTRHGYGMYISEDDGTVYLGHWRKDKMYYGRVKYPNGITYIGNLKHSKYNGKGNYRVPGVGNILSSFIHNLPSAEVVLVDENGFYWCGSVNHGGGVLLCPVNPFHNDPLWHEDTSDISEVNRNKTPLTLHVSKIAPSYSIWDVNMKLMKALHDGKHYNRFL